MIEPVIINDLKTVVLYSKACKIGPDCVLESKFGKVIIDISKYGDVSKVVLFAKRLSGDGRIYIGGNEIVVHSKSSQQIELQSSTIEIIRPLNGIGEVSIFAISLYYENSSEKECNLGHNWKKLINRCGEYHCLRMIGVRLFATQGAYITNGKVVKKIETTPPDQTVLENGSLKFIGACEIIDLEVDETAPIIPSPTSTIYEHRDPPQPLFSPIESIKSQQSNTRAIHPIKVIPAKQTAPNQFQFIYDSAAVREFTAINKKKTKSIKFTRSNGEDYMILQRGGNYNIVLSTVEPNESYVVLIKAKRLSGNGRLIISFRTSENVGVEESIIVDGQLREHSVVLKTNNIHDGQFLLNVGMDNTSVGEIIVSKIRVLKGTFYSNSINTATTINGDTNIINYSQYSSLIKSEKNKFVIVIPSYKNSKYCERNIHSTLTQDYERYRVIFTDDNSSDDTFEKVSKVVNSSNRRNKFTLIKNQERIGALANLYNMIHSCEDDEIILTLDGDDWLSDENVLNKLNNYYNSDDIWMTYGQYQNWPDLGTGIAQQIPSHVIAANNFRGYTWCSSHLRTFYAWLFKQIKREDMMYKGEFMGMAWDMTIMFPLLEMSGHRSKFINDILYMYNMENPINDHKVNLALQQSLDRYVRSMPRYQKLPCPILKEKTIGLMVIATNKYDRFIQGLISSADNYFLNEPNIKVKYYVFSDRQHKIHSNREVVQLHVDHKPFPYASLNRFKYFNEHSSVLSKEDYLFYVDVDCLFVDSVHSNEILGSLVGVRHCGFINTPGPYETNEKSIIYTDPAKYKYYFGGGLSGGNSKKYLQLAKTCNEWIDTDLSNNIMPLWHDESVLNKYFLDSPPDVVLTPSFHYPQSQKERYKELWSPYSFNPKILLLDKKHNQVR